MNDVIKCSISKKCGSCQLIEKEYNETLKIKLNKINDLFKKNNIKYNITEINKSPKTIQYRNKMIVGFKYLNNNIIAGFYEENSHKIVPLDSCLMHSDIQNKIVKEVVTIMKTLKLKPYDEDKKTGLIRYMVIKEAINTKEMMVIIVTAQEIFPGSNEFCKRVRLTDKNIKTIVQNINPRKTSVVLGDKEKILYGNGQISDILLNLKFNITPKSFYQVNPLQTENLYKRVNDYCDFKGDEIIIDAYSGIGTIGIYLSSNVKKVISVENNKQAHLAAINNAKNNQIKNVFFYNDDATDFIYKLALNKEKIDVVIMDPPRSGSTDKFIMSCIKLKPRKIVYVSCGPESLVVDLQLFIKNGYEVKKVSCFDMFCYTEHVETVVLLTRQSNNDRVNVKLNYDNKNKKTNNKIV